jgi:hypothetical protein
VNRDRRTRADRFVTGFQLGAADDTVLVGHAADPSGRVRAVLQNYACHPTSSRRISLSPDYPERCGVDRKQVPARWRSIPRPFGR